jgi:hypothetical protein
MQLVPVFISHSWSYSDHYQKLSEWVFGESWTANGEQISFVDRSIPKDNPVHNARNADALRAAIYDRIVLSRVVVIPMGMYATHSKWIQEEIAGSKYYRKPILAVNPWGQERKSSVVLANSTADCGWNKLSVANAIWSLCQKAAA